MSESKDACAVVENTDEEDMMENPQAKLREKCGQAKQCAMLEKKLATCNDRVNSKTKTTETCKEELIDFMHCVDTCVAKTLFKYLK